MSEIRNNLENPFGEGPTVCTCGIGPLAMRDSGCKDSFSEGTMALWNISSVRGGLLGWFWFPTSVKAMSHFQLSQFMADTVTILDMFLWQTTFPQGPVNRADAPARANFPDCHPTYAMFKKKVWGYAFMMFVKIYRNIDFSTVMNASWTQLTTPPHPGTGVTLLGFLWSWCSVSRTPGEPPCRRENLTGGGARLFWGWGTNSGDVSWKARAYQSGSWESPKKWYRNKLRRAPWYSRFLAKWINASVVYSLSFKASSTDEH